MLNEWIHWLSSLQYIDIACLVVGLLIIDTPRYAVSRLTMCVVDYLLDMFSWLRGVPEQAQYDYCPSVCVILAGYNEGETVAGTMESLLGSYPRMEMIVVDDGSGDGMADIARPYAAKHPNVLVLHRKERGGKSSAMNFALPYTSADVILSVDCDSTLSPTALWEIVQPFKDPKVGAVSATILARNPYDNLCTWMQAYEYLHSIFVGRLLSQRLGILSITAGAFAALRRDVVERMRGWDVGPAEDLDMTLRIRKAGYKIVAAQYSICSTDVPTKWRVLWKQRLRWEEGAVIRNNLRKHIDMADPTTKNFD